MRYVTHAYGLYAEIEADLVKASGGRRSERRKEQADEALEKLRSGALEIHIGDVVYHVQTLGESLDDLLGIAPSE